jgi:hypothetical protein
MIIAGIDPGLKGAVAFYRPDVNQIAVVDMPVVDGEVSAPLLVRLVRQNAPTFAMIEEARSMPHDGHVGAFRFGCAVGDARSVFSTLEVPLHRVTPQRWKRHYGLTKDKEASRNLAISLMPKAAEYLTLKKHHNRAEAILIALYANYYYFKIAGAKIND